MLLTDEQIEARVSSSGNLLNRLGISTNRAKPAIVSASPCLPSHTKETAAVPGLPVIDLKQERNPGQLTIDDLIDDVDTKIQIGQTHSKSINVLNRTLDRLSERLDEVDKPEKLATMAHYMHRIVNEQKKKAEHEESITPQIIIYKPMMINVDELSIVNVSD